MKHNNGDDISLNLDTASYCRIIKKGVPCALFYIHIVPDATMSSVIIHCIKKNYFPRAVTIAIYIYRVGSEISI